MGDKKDAMIPKRLAREVIYENEWVSLYADKVQYPGGHILDRHHLVHFDYESVAVVIQNEKDEILLIKSARYTTQSLEWEIPAGRVEKDEPSLNAALRESLEETGYSLSTPELVYKYNPMNGISDKVAAIYKAKALKKEAEYDSGEVIETRWVSKETIYEMIRRNELCSGLTVTGLMLVLFFEM